MSLRIVPHCDGGYEAFLYLGKSVTGKPIRSYKRLPDARSKDEANAHAEAWLKRNEAAARLSTTLVVGEAFERFIDVRESAGYARGTVKAERSLLRCHIARYLGRMKVDEVSPGMVMDMYAAMLNDDGVSASRVRDCHWLLSRAWNWFVRHGLCDVNPISCVDAPKAKPKEAVSLDSFESRRLVGAINEALSDDGADCSEMVRITALAAWIALQTGMRVGEVCALRVRDVRTDIGVLSVRGTVEEVKGAGPLRKDSPKTKSSCRNVVVAPEVFRILGEFVAMQESRFGSKARDCPLLTKDGKRFVRPSEVSRTFSAYFRKRAGLDESCTFHTLRHTHASMLINSRHSPKAVQERLGHSDVSTTLGLYSHAADDAQARAAQEVAGAFSLE